MWQQMSIPLLAGLQKIRILLTEKKVICLTCWSLNSAARGQLYLLGYTLEQEVCLIYLEAAGPHENFYRDLKR